MKNISNTPPRSRAPLALLALLLAIFTASASAAPPPPASFLFMIDNSGSMYSNSGSRPGSDPLGRRFRATVAIIDSIYAAHPDAEVGLILFTDALQFDSDDDSRLVEFAGHTAGVARQSYLPLLPLNTAISADGYFDAAVAGDAGATYRGLLRSLFSIPTDIDLQAKIRVRTIGDQYADISLAFEAAAQAFAASGADKSNQHIIFFTDGEANVVPSSRNPERFSRRFDYVRGARTPTTYTLFLTNGGTRDMCPVALDTFAVIPRNAAGLPVDFYQTLELSGLSAGSLVAGMTRAIRDNGYSATNPQSNIWVFGDDYGDLLDVAIDSVIRPVIIPANDVELAPPPPAVASSPRGSGVFTAGRNPVSLRSGSVDFFYQGVRVSRGDLRIYDSSGNLVKRVRLSAGSSSWDLTNFRNRQVSEGSYLVRGTISANGRRHRVSTTIGVAR